MNTVTIPKNLIREKELVLIPRREYEELLILKSKKKSKINKNLEEALEDVKYGRLIGPFTSVKEGLRAVKRAK
ncbi:MAG: hypothetical protein Q7K44_02625 [Candidatus Liptonbacteria bacterium]|nr:hypothetical protein [Candidatus Liptonbacteria bacterium]